MPPSGMMIYNTSLGSGSQTFTFNFTAPTSGVYDIEFERIGNNSNCTFYIDDIEIREEYDMEMCWVDDYNDYRYGFQGYEKDDEAKGNGNSYTTMFRQYDPRLARWFTIDPVLKSSESPYANVSNNPLNIIDLRGADSTKLNGKWHWQIEEGDSYESVAERVGIDVDELKSWNESNVGFEPGNFLSITGKAHFVYEHLTPTIFTTTVSALTANPLWSTLHYIGAPSQTPGATSQKRKNRYYGTKNCPTCPTGFSKDEFPYASTIEGGSRSFCQCTPVLEQQLQAQHLRLLYSGMKAGDAFSIIPVPANMVPEPVPSPVPDPVPVPIPIKEDIKKPVNQPVLQPVTQPVFSPQPVQIPPPPTMNDVQTTVTVAEILIIVTIIVLIPVGI